MPQVIVKVHPDSTISSFELIAGLTVVSDEFQNAFPDVTCSSGNGYSECPTPICSLQNHSLAYCRAFNFDIPVGVLLPLSGDGAFLGTSSQNTLDLIVSSLGYDYPQLQLIVADTMSTGDGALSVAQNMYKSGIRIFVGPMTSAESITVVDWASKNANDSIFISPSASSTQFAAYRNYFSLVMDNSAFAPAILTMISKKRNNTATNAVLLRRNDSFATDLAFQVSVRSSSYRVTIASEVIYNPGLSSAKDAAKILGSINTTGVDVLIVIAFDEIGYLLEAAKGYTNLTKILWIGSGFSSSANVMQSADSLYVARAVQLTSLEYVGANLGDEYGYNQFFEQLANRQGGLVSPLAAMVYDAILLAYNNGYIYRTTDVEIVLSSLVTESRSEFGISGWLLLNDQGFRAKGSLLVSSIAPTPTPLNLDWMEEATVDMRPGFTGGFDVFVKNTGFHPIPPLLLQNCTSQVQVSARDISRRVVTYDLMSFNTFGLPAYDNFTVVLSCGQSVIHMECPSSFYGADARCSFFLPGGKRGYIVTFLACGAAVASCATPVGWVCPGAILGCAALAVDQCCQQQLADWCCL